MAWRNAAESVRFDVLGYAFRGGLDIGAGAHKIMPHFVAIDSGQYYDGELVGGAACEQADMLVSTCDEMPIFADAAFETVFSSHLLDCVTDPRSSLREWWRLVRVGGHLILHLPFGPQKIERKCRAHSLTPDRVLTMMLEDATGWNLKVSTIRDDNTFLQVYGRGDEIKQDWLNLPSAKTVGIVRPGALGDALWSASVAKAYKDEGYHVTMYQSPPGADVLRHDPHIDRMIEIAQMWFPDRVWDAFYAHEAKKYDNFVNLISSVETTLLPHTSSATFFWPHDVRHRHMNRNYMEATHEIADLPASVPYLPRFYPTQDERDRMMAYRQKHAPGPLVVLAPTGSNEVKTWPHTQALLDALCKQGVYVVVLGDIRPNLSFTEPYGLIVGTALPVRSAMTLAGLADVVVGIESAVLNSVAVEDNFKVALLLHSSAENLTKHWNNTVALEPQGVACYPCHRIHEDFTYCHKDESTGWARCQSWATADKVLDLILPRLSLPKREAA